MAGRTIIIGDVHGCLAELQELLTKLKVRPLEDRLIFVGDIVDRGPDSLGCLRLVQGLGAECLLGNHEEKYVRWHRYETIRKATGKANPMSSMTDEKLALYEQLDDFDLEWMKALPPYIELPDHGGCSWLVVHGGFEPAKELWEQDTRKMIRCRWVDKKGSYLKINMQTTIVKGHRVLSKPEGGIRWTDMWDRKERVIYGHAVRDLEEPTCEGHTIGIDTGCCFGGRLTAYVMEEQATPIMTIGDKVQIPGRYPDHYGKLDWMDISYIVQVDAKKIYAKALLDAA
jgi:bis(5'-nucleosyl)-tetraphosphatase (symmetrical)